ncbi:hypothetical protein M8C21_000915 [Ambrosia artemisiifolia]|uniref:Uncharacterized protein n=1 Tax=Ambrosia artemisiifolia TaxID=4212 RepID=A0AAD5BRP7_AMBAR|nr:hypothetical protein M8C21_000915 [Ambrosia artemisiifolia]
MEVTDDLEEAMAIVMVMGVGGGRFGGGKRFVMVMTVGVGGGCCHGSGGAMLVADFGLTKLTEVGSSSLATCLVADLDHPFGPLGYISAVDQVLYWIDAAKEAIIKANGSDDEPKGLVAMFEEVLSQPDPKADLIKMVDPRLGDNYPLDSVRKMAQLAKACTHKNPHLRPSMQSVVVALMILLSSTENWDVGSFYENQNLMSLMSGR